MEENESVFRKKSLDRVNSPEDLDHYLKVTNPSFWMFLIAILILLLGVIVWSIFGKMEAYVDTGCVISDGEYACYIDEDNYTRLKDDGTLRIDDTDYTFNVDELEYVSSQDVEAYVLKLGNITSDNVFMITGKAALTNGYYEGKIITEEISPISFIID